MGALLTLGSVSVSHEGPGILEPTGVTGNADAREVEPSGVDAHEPGGASLPVSAAPALAEGTAGIKPAGKAERATATRRWHPGRKVRPSAKSRGREKPKGCTGCCNEIASSYVHERGQNANPKLRHRRKRGGATTRGRARTWQSATRQSGRVRVTLKSATPDDFEGYLPWTLVSWRKQAGEDVFEPKRACKANQ